MKKLKNFKKILTVLVSLIMCMALILSFTACDKEAEIKDPDIVAKAEIKENVPNGSFYAATGDTFPKAPSNWTGAAGESNGENVTPVGQDNLINGVLNTTQAINNKNLLGEIDVTSAPYHASGDDNVMMFYNKVPTVYQYMNSKLNLQVGNYYRIDVWVRTVNIAGDAKAGAYLSFSGNVSNRFNQINTNGEWVKYSLYVESSAIETKSVTINIGLGSGDKLAGAMTSGYAFYDSIDATIITENEYNNPAGTPDRYQKYSMRFMNPTFEFSNELGDVSAATNYSTLYDSNEAGNSPYGSAYTNRGVIDLTNTTYIQNTLKLDAISKANANIADNKVLLIQNYKYPEAKPGTAVGYQSSKFRIPMGKIVKLSVWIYTDIGTEYFSSSENKMITDTNRGVTLKLKGNTEVKSKVINTNKQWNQYTFYVQGSDIYNYDYMFEMWLGQGGKDAFDTFAWGVALFDDIKVEYISANEFNAVNPVTDTMVSKTTLTTSPNLIVNGNFNANLEDNWKLGAIDESIIIGSNDVIVRTLTWNQLNDAAFMKTLGVADKDGNGTAISAPHENFAPVVMINNKIPNAYELKMKDSLTLKKNLYYRVSVWVRTYGIESGKGATINLYEIGKDNKETSLQSFTNVNTEGYTNTLTSNYRQYNIYVEGAEFEDKNVKINVALGSGTTTNIANFLKGFVFVANVNVCNITYDEYKNASTSSGFDAKKSLLTSDSNISNGKFNFVDKDDKTAFNENGEMVKLGAPKDWDKWGTAADLGNANYGIGTILPSSPVSSEYTFAFSNVYNGWKGTNTDTNPISGSIMGSGEPNFLFLQSKPASGEYTGSLTKAIGFKTEDEFSLSASSFYLIFVDVKTVGADSRASIYLTPTTNINGRHFENINTEGKWSEYVFGVSVGMTSTSVDLTLLNGSNNSAANPTSGTVYFDNIRYIKYTDLDSYDEQKNKYKLGDTFVPEFIETSFTTESFDQSTSSQPINKPSNFSSNVAVGDDGTTKAPNGTDNQISGVLNANSELTKFGVFDSENNIIENSKMTGELLTTILSNGAMANSGFTVGENVLVINNKVNSGLGYKTSSGKTLSSNKYYEISVWAKTFYLEQNKGATIILHVGDETYTYSNINTNKPAEGQEYNKATVGEWTKYSFYVSNEQSSSLFSTYVTLALGTKGEANWLQGYAFFDNYVIKEISKTVFDEAATRIPEPAPGENNITPKRKTDTEWVIVYKKDATENNEADKPSEEETPNEEKKPSQFPWLLVSSLSIAAVLIVVVVVVLWKKFKKKTPVIKDKNRAAYDKRSSNNPKAKSRRSDYDNYRDKK